MIHSAPHEECRGHIQSEPVHLSVVVLAAIVFAAFTIAAAAAVATAPATVRMPQVVKGSGLGWKDGRMSQLKQTRINKECELQVRAPVPGPSLEPMNMFSEKRKNEKKKKKKNAALPNVPSGIYQPLILQGLMLNLA